jgi:hypothetical protein
VTESMHGPGGGDPAGQGPAGQPSEQELREYVERLRNAPVDQVLAEVSSALLNAAQVKLGRRDGRLLLDTVAAVADAVRGRAADELLAQLDEALTQLRLAQVDAERQVAAAEASGHRETGDVDPHPGDEQAAGATDGPGTPPTQPPPGGSARGRLWTPGG